jgi:hypothetical protein
MTWFLENVTLLIKLYLCNRINKVTTLIIAVSNKWEASSLVWNYYQNYCLGRWLTITIFKICKYNNYNLAYNVDCLSVFLVRLIIRLKIIFVVYFQKFPLVFICTYSYVVVYTAYDISNLIKVSRRCELKYENRFSACVH